MVKAMFGFAVELLSPEVVPFDAESPALAVSFFGAGALQAVASANERAKRSRRGRGNFMVKLGKRKDAIVDAKTNGGHGEFRRAAQPVDRAGLGF